MQWHDCEDSSKIDIDCSKDNDDTNNHKSQNFKASALLEKIEHFEKGIVGSKFAPYNLEQMLKLSFYGRVDMPKFFELYTVGKPPTI